MKVFQIGFSKCGTSSLHHRFGLLGLRSLHNVIPDTSEKVALRMRESLQTGRSIMDGLWDYDAFTDLVYLSNTEHIEAFKYYRAFLAAVPSANFILNVRSVDRWIASCRQHSNLFARLQKVYGFQDDADVEAYLRTEWKTHVDAVKATIPGERLLVFDIEKDDARNIDRFLGIDNDLPARLTHENFSPGPIHLLLMKLPAGVKERVPSTARKRFTTGYANAADPPHSLVGQKHGCENT